MTEETLLYIGDGGEKNMVNAKGLTTIRTCILSQGGT